MGFRIGRVEATEIQCDEIWSFVAAKERTTFIKNMSEDAGDCYTFTAIVRKTKMLICYHVGKRSTEDTNRFAEKLARHVSGRPHISADGFPPCQFAIPHYFNYEVDHSVIVKRFGFYSNGSTHRYSPAKIVSIKHRDNWRQSIPNQTCTSHVERSNLTIRMLNRRFTRLTNAFSKKRSNHEAMFALFAAWYDFCRKHQTIKMTPAVVTGIATEPWTIERLWSNQPA